MSNGAPKFKIKHHANDCVVWSARNTQDPKGYLVLKDHFNSATYFAILKGPERVEVTAVGKSLKLMNYYFS